MFGKSFIDILKADNIDTENVTFTDQAPTPVASIIVDNDGNQLSNRNIYYLKQLFTWMVLFSDSQSS